MTHEEVDAPPFCAVSAGGEHTLLTAANGSLFACGRGDGGRLGLGPPSGRLVMDDNGLTRRLFEDAWLPTEVDVRNSRFGACGEYHSFSVCQSPNGTDDVLSWGCGAVGQLGHPSSLDDVHTPQSMEYLSTLLTRSEQHGVHVVGMSLGDGHSIVVLSDGSVHGFGNNESAVLGTTVGGGGGGCVKHSERYGFAVRGASRLQPTQLPGLGQQHIVQAATSTRHSLFVAQSGELFACGDNACGQIGLGKALARGTIIRRVPLQTTRKVTKAAAGAEHSVVLLDDHTIMVCGSNKSGELGLGEEVHQVETFTVLENSAPIVDIAAGAAHTVLLDAGGTVWVCGWGACGSLGVNHLSNVYTLRVSPVPSEWGRPVAVSCSSHHTILLFDNGTAAAAGSNGHGQLGLGHNQKEVSEWQLIRKVKRLRHKNCSTSPARSEGTAITEETTALDVLSRNFAPRIRSCPVPESSVEEVAEPS